MRIGIVGLPQVGKTTIFNLLTHGCADTSGWRGKVDTHIGVARVPDPRLERLADLFRPQKVTHATIDYLDVPGFPCGQGMAAGEGQSRDRIACLNTLQDADALAHVVRAFEDENIPHSEGTVDPLRDITLFELEMIFSDLSIIEKRLQRLSKDLRKTKSDELEHENILLQRLKVALEQEQPLRELTLTAREKKIARGFAFLSAKPILLLLNLDDRDTAKILRASQEFHLEEQASRPNVGVCAVCGKIESEIASLSRDDARMFMEDLRLTSGGLERIVENSYALLNVSSFYTTEGSELRAWTFPQNTTALQAAGMIHTDIARGFIKAEVVAYPELLELGSFQAARSKGTLRLEGKDYMVQDGDVILFRFNL